MPGDITITNNDTMLGYIHYRIMLEYSNWYKILNKKQFGDNIDNIFLDISEFDNLILTTLFIKMNHIPIGMKVI